jgi:hypothetical protein
MVESSLVPRESNTAHTLQEPYFMLILRCQEQAQATVVGVLFQSLLDIRHSLVQY